MSYSPHNRKTIRKDNSKKQVKGSSWFKRFFWWSFKLGAAIGLFVLLAIFGVVYNFYKDLPELEKLIDGRAGGSVTFLDRNGEAFAWRGDQFDTNLRAENASPDLINAVIATEDKRFYRHFGISIRGVVRALIRNYKENGDPFRGEGGSTITIQVAKLLCLGVEYDPQAGSYVDYERECRRATMERKLKEFPFAMALEWKYSKADILSIYLNRAYLGAGAYGFGAAANRYFDVPANGLNVQQSAMLAGMLTAPSRFAPTNNLERAQNRSKTVLRLMREQGLITEAQYEAAFANPAILSASARLDEGVFFADWLMVTQPDFLTTASSEDVVYRTTYDANIQRIARNAVEKVSSQWSASSRAQVGIVVMEKNGAVRAMVGGRFAEDRIEQGFNRAISAQRQPGSSFKPFVYAAGLEAGMHPYEIFDDSPITVNIPGQGSYTPRNYTERYRGDITMIDALKNSVNTVAVEISENAGRDNVRKLARDFGIYSKLVDGPSLALGSGEVNLLEITSAYAGIANNARPVAPFGWTALGLKNTGELLQTNDPQVAAPIMSRQNVGWLIYMMKNVVDGGTGTGARISGHQIAGKTGTTNEARDAWFIGFSDNWVVGVWMGNDDNKPLKGTTGGGFPAEIFRETMTPILSKYGSNPLPLITPQPLPPEPQVAPETNAVDTNAVVNQLLDLLLN